MLQRKLRPLTAVLLSLVLFGGACSSGGGSGSARAARKLAAKIIPAPTGYLVDTTPGAIGPVTPALFAQFGGVGSPRTTGFVIGYKGNYVNDATGEGISVTLLQFASANAAAAYLSQTASKTLAFAAATYKPYAEIPGATEADGTKAYGGEYAHGIVMVRGSYYALLVYVNEQSGPAPVEINRWAQSQYARLS